MTEHLVSIHRASKASRLAAQDASALISPTPEHPLIISASELRDFMRCRVRWHWRYQCQLVPVGGKEALSMGTLVHDILETWYKLAPKKRTQKAMETIAKARVRTTKLDALDSDARELIEAMTIGYAAWAKEADKEIGLETSFPEEWFELPLIEDGSIIVRGRIDNRFHPTNKKKTVACQETKTAGQFRDKGLDTLLQVSLYLWALRVQFPKEKRYIAYYTELRKQIPSPRVKAPLFQRQEVERTAEEIDIWIQDTRRAALDMLNAAIYPNQNANCSWDCDFQNACMLRGSPDDLKHVLRTQFKQKEKRA
jgi:hypothetical protein